MNPCPHANSLRAGAAAFNLCLMVVALQSPGRLSAQQAILESLNAQAASLPKPIDLEALPYTVKSGDFRLLLTPTLEMDWNSDINISRSNTLSAFILKPLLQIDATYPITQLNTLRLDVGVGYDEYLEHSDYSNWRANSGSQISFDTYIKDVLIDLHDRFSFTQDAGAQAVDAGVGNYSSGNNVVGLTSTWNPKNLNIVLGYDHKNVISSGTSIQSQNGSSDLFDGRVGWRFDPATTAGVEATYSSTAYDEAILNNNTSYTVGAYGEWHPDAYFSVMPRAGYSIFQFQQTSQSSEIPGLTPAGKPISTSDFNTWYADLTLKHEITRALSYTLSVGHEIQAGLTSDEVSDSYLRLSATWKVLRDWDLHGAFSYEHGQQGVGNLSGNVTETFNWYTGSIDLNRQLTRRLRVGLISRITYRSSTTEALSYTQAIVGLQMAYAL